MPVGTRHVIIGFIDVAAGKEIRPRVRLVGSLHYISVFECSSK